MTIQDQRFGNKLFMNGKDYNHKQGFPLDLSSVHIKQEIA